MLTWRHVLRSYSVCCPELLSYMRVPLMMTRWAGRLTPTARVEVVQITCADANPRISGWVRFHVCTCLAPLWIEAQKEIYMRLGIGRGSGDRYQRSRQREASRARSLFLTSNGAPGERPEGAKAGTAHHDILAAEQGFHCQPVALLQRRVMEGHPAPDRRLELLVPEALRGRRQPLLLLRAADEELPAPCLGLAGQLRSPEAELCSSILAVPPEVSHFAGQGWAPFSTARIQDRDSGAAVQGRAAQPRSTRDSCRATDLSGCIA